MAGSSKSKIWQAVIFFNRLAILCRRVSRFEGESWSAAITPIPAARSVHFGRAFCRSYSQSCHPLLRRDHDLVSQITAYCDSHISYLLGQQFGKAVDGAGRDRAQMH